MSIGRRRSCIDRSTDEPLQTTPLHEGSPLRTNDFPYRKLGADPDDWRYDYDKIPIERLLLEELSFQTTVLRLPAVYGPRDYTLLPARHLSYSPRQRLASHPVALPTLLYQSRKWCTSTQVTEMVR